MLQVAMGGEVISSSVVFEYKARDLPALPSSQHDWLSLDGESILFVYSDHTGTCVTLLLSGCIYYHTNHKQESTAVFLTAQHNCLTASSYARSDACFNNKHSTGREKMHGYFFFFFTCTYLLCLCLEKLNLKASYKIHHILILSCHTHFLYQLKLRKPVDVVRVCGFFPCWMLCHVVKCFVHSR